MVTATFEIVLHLETLWYKFNLLSMQLLKRSTSQFTVYSHVLYKTELKCLGPLLLTKALSTGPSEVNF